ncbi:MAG: VCBS repeat-containing protein [Planctomycetota bacterium]
MHLARLVRPLAPLLALAASAPSTAQSGFAPFQPLTFIDGEEIAPETTGVADFDGDALVDRFGVGVSAAGERVVYLLRGLGGRRFAEPVVLAVGATEIPPAAGDLEGDGDVDLVYATATGRLAILENLGGGSFASTTSVPIPFPAGLQLGDADADGDLDVLFIEGAGLRTAAVAYLDQGAWTSDVRRSGRAFTNFPGRTRAADFDGDGRVDLLTRERVETTLLYRSNGAGFDPPVELQLGDATNSSTVPIAAALDVNGDGLLDLVPYGTQMRAPVFLGDGAFGFTPSDLVDDPGTVVQVRGVFDADGDGREDVLYRSSTGLRLAVGAGTVPLDAGALADPSLDVGLSAFPSFVDGDGDGSGDFLFESTETRIRYGPMTGAPLAHEPQEPFGFEPVGARVDRLQVLDFDGDGDPDVIGIVDAFSGPGSSGTGFVRVENLGGARFDVRYGFGPAFDFIDLTAAGDFDGDGRDELALSAVFPGDPSIFIDVAVYGFDDAGEANLLLRVPRDSRFLRAADVNADGIEDLVYVDSSDRVSVHLGSPSGLAATPIDTDLGGFLADLQLVDGDFDGDPDAYVTTNSSVVGYAPNLGDGTFGPLTTVPGVEFGRVGDFDGDGRPDIVALESNRDLVLQRGTAPAAFGPPTLLRANATINFPVWSRLVDVDGDGALDFATSRSQLVSGGGTGVFFGDGTGGLRGELGVTGSRPVLRPAAFADVDGDGDADLLEVWSTIDQVQFAENLVVPRSGVVVCEQPVPNSTSRSGRIDVYGVPAAAGAPLRLLASSLPRNVFGFFIGAPTSAPPVVIPGSVGSLCLGPNLGRYIGPGEIGVSGAAGAFELEVAPSDLRSGGSVVTATAGLTWTFQAWHRDVVGGASTSNLTSAVTVTYE